MTSSRPRRAAEVALSVGAAAGLLCTVLAVLALVLDLRVLTFRSGSMSPTIRTGALAVARHVRAADLRVGDVVSVRTATGSRVTHRVVGIEHLGGKDTDAARVELRGDANTAADPEPYVVTHADRVWFAVPLLGYAAAVIAGPLGLAALALYAFFLLRVLLRAEEGRRAGGRRRAHRRTGAAVLALVVLTATATGTVGARSSGTLAAWTDSVATSASSTVATATIAKPATFTCGLVGVFSVTFNWTAVAGATSYTLHYGNGGAQTMSVSGTSATITAVISGGTAWVTAEKNFGAVTWTSAATATRTYSVIALSLCT